MSVRPGQNGTSPSRRSSNSSSSSSPTSARASATGSAPPRTRVAAASNSLTGPVPPLAAIGEVLLVLLGRRGQRRVGIELRLHLLPRLRALGRDVLGGPVPLVRAVALEHVAGDGRLVHLVDTVGDAHRRRGRV